MSKFTKKSLAVLTTAAIMASTASVVSYAAFGVTITWDDANIVSVANNGTAVTSGGTASVDVGTLTIEVAKGYKPVVTSGGAELTVSGSGTSYTCDASSIAAGGSATITTVASSTGGSSEPTPAGEENFDNVVWVNGKDTKENTKVTPATPASLYKTEQFDQVMTSAGGKWQVAVTDKTIDSVEAFVALFENGKYTADAKTKAKEWKKLASAKIKEGTVTVTAGKEAGVVNVWVYEVKSKTVVAPVEGNKYADLGVEPQMTEFTVKVAPAMAVSANEPKVSEDGITFAAVDTSAKLGKDIEAGKDVIVYFGDKKAAASLDATYVLMDGKGKEALEVDESGVAKIENGTAQLIKTENGVPALKITADSAAAAKAKIAVAVKNVESTKVAKVSLTVKASETKEDDKGGDDKTDEGGNSDTPAA